VCSFPEIVESNVHNTHEHSTRTLNSKSLTHFTAESTVGVFVSTPNVVTVWTAIQHIREKSSHLCVRVCVFA